MSAVGNELTSKLKVIADGVTKLQENVVIDQDVYEVYKVVLPKSSVDPVQIDILLAPTNLVAIMADSYQDRGVDVLSYKVHSAGGDEIVLDNMQVFNGFDMVAKLGTLDAILFYSASTVANRTVTVIIARDKEKT